MKRLACLALLLFGVCTSFAQSETGWSRWTVFAGNHLALDRLIASDLRLFQENYAIGPNDVIVQPGEMIKLLTLNLPVQFVSDLPDPRNWQATHNEPALDYHNTYLNLSQVIQQCETFRSNYPNLVTRQQIATTVNGNPVWVYKLHNTNPISGNKPPQKVILMTFGIHAREWISESVGLYIMDNTLQEAASDPNWLWYLTMNEIDIVPVYNPDGYDYTWNYDRYWRKNRRNNGHGNYGVDQNRNFPVGWGGQGSSSDPSNDTYRGPSAASEPETQGLLNYCSSLKSLIGFIDYHSYSELLMWPYGYTSQLCKDNSAFNALGTVMQTAIYNVNKVKYTTGPVYTTIYPAAGVTVDTMYTNYNTWAYTIELRDTGQYGFDLPTNQILPTQQENWAGYVQLVQALFPGIYK